MEMVLLILKKESRRSDMCVCKFWTNKQLDIDLFSIISAEWNLFTFSIKSYNNK